MDNGNIMPISTQQVAIEQFTDISKTSSESGKQLNQLFFNMMLKPMFNSSIANVKSSSTVQMHQQLYLNTLSQELSENFDLGFSKLQHSIEQQDNK